jgi:hypothetical protein
MHAFKTWSTCTRFLSVMKIRKHWRVLAPHIPISRIISLLIFFSQRLQSMAKITMSEGGAEIASYVRSASL